MGGAVALLLHLKAPTYWSGAVLVSPMCKVLHLVVVVVVIRVRCEVILTLDPNFYRSMRR